MNISDDNVTTLDPASTNLLLASNKVDGRRTRPETAMRSARCIA